MLDYMKAAYWSISVTIGVSISFILSFFGFWEMNYELFVNHSAYNPPPPSWYSGLRLFFIGMIPFIVTVAAERRFNNETKTRFYLRIVKFLKFFEISYLVLIVYLVLISVGAYPPNNII